MKRQLYWFAGICLLSSQVLWADNLVLIQGYLGDGSGWRTSGVAHQLVTAGWVDAGHLSQSPAGVQLQSVAPTPKVNAKRFFTLSLPTEAPFFVQENILQSYLKAIQREQPDEDIILVGHSAGGVLARLMMVRHSDFSIRLLVTIATPNRGTGLAETAVKAGKSPLAWVATMFGANTLNRSQALYHELVRERPGSMLFWLNRQPHPTARYVSVIHDEDDVVAPQSQDLRQVVALQHRAQSWVLPVEHSLTPQDGRVIVQIVSTEGKGQKLFAH